MPEYNYECEKCEHVFDKIWHMSEYEQKSKNVRCPKCRSRKVFRDMSKVRITPHYVKGLHECTTLGEYAEKQTKKYGKAKCEEMRREFNKFDDPANRTGGMEELPAGMTRMRETGAGNMPSPTTKKQAKAKRKGKKTK